MTWFNKLMGRTKEHTLTPQIKSSEILNQSGLPFRMGNGQFVYQEPTLLKKLKWVTYKGKVGIVTDLSSAGTAVVDFVDSDGYTIESDRCPVGEISLARYDDIPSSRRHPDPQYMAQLGYI